MEMEVPHLEELRQAKELLENPGFAAKLTGILGTPLEKGFKLLPERWQDSVQQATRDSLSKALAVAVRTLGDRPKKPASEKAHKILVAASGAAAGALGLPALVVELPLSTTLMLRSIADIARSEGENIREIAARLACLEVFALGGKPGVESAAETGYFAIRIALARTMSEAAAFIAERGLIEEGSPVLVRLIATLAARFGAVVSEKAAAQAIPILGAAGGALVNTLFIGHFQEMARGHFTVRRLERIYGADSVQLLYERL